MEKSYKDIVEIKTVKDDEEVNHLLSNGWILLRTDTGYKGGAGFTLKPLFIVGRKDLKKVKA